MDLSSGVTAMRTGLRGELEVARNKSGRKDSMATERFWRFPEVLGGGSVEVNLALFHRPGWRNGRRTALKMRRGRPREGFESLSRHHRHKFLGWVQRARAPRTRLDQWRRSTGTRMSRPICNSVQRRTSIASSVRRWKTRRRERSNLGSPRCSRGQAWALEGLDTPGGWYECGNDDAQPPQRRDHSSNVSRRA